MPIVIKVRTIHSLCNLLISYKPENVNPGYFAVGKLGRADLFHLSSLTESPVNVGS